MDRERVIALAEGEIMRKINRAKLCKAEEAVQLLEVADALTVVLDAYRRSHDWTQAQRLVIPTTLPGLNEYIEAERSHRQKGAAMKRQWQKAVALALRNQLRGRLREPVTIRYTWYERDRRRDKDNISGFGRKIIQDALVQDLHVLENDGWANIEGFSDRFRVDKLHPRAEIEITEAEV